MRIRNLPFAALVLPIALGAVAPAHVAGQESSAAPPGGETEASRRSQVVSGDLTIAEGETVEEVVVIGGDLEVHGEVTGDASVFGGDLVLGETGVIGGDAVVTGGRFVNEGGRIRGEMRAIEGRGVDVAREIQRALGGVAA
ncbi:MAG TPA: hypothetical protein VMN39_08070, partial [Longimicrobiaceae bacterium]|nr:hypothetical protein [Longimicrobiaceae bacterium]